jgi:hypothetical protein
MLLYARLCVQGHPAAENVGDKIPLRNNLNRAATYRPESWRCERNSRNALPTLRRCSGAASKGSCPGVARPCAPEREQPRISVVLKDARTLRQTARVVLHTMIETNRPNNIAGLPPDVSVGAHCTFCRRSSTCIQSSRSKKVRSFAIYKHAHTFITCETPVDASRQMHKQGHSVFRPRGSGLPR